MSSKRRSRKDDTEEEGAHNTTPHRKLSPQSSALDEEKQQDAGGVRDNDDDEGGDDVDDLEDENVDSEDGSLLIVDMQDNKDTDDTEKDSLHSEEEEQTQLVFNGTMTRRQSRQFQDAGENFAVFSVRSGIKTKNRTCEYCGVAKATPAALVRHIRKHTGEKPFICQLCGKAYKAKRSLHLHQNSHHRDTGQMLPPNLSAPPTQVSLSLSLQPQNSPTQAISEATKSLLRETLESSRKARDGSIGIQIPESVSGISPRVSERLPTPNLVNLLTTDLTNKAQLATEPIFLTKAVDLSKVAMDTSTKFILSPPLIKKEKEDEVEDEEEQAQDLSMQTMKKVASVSSARQSSSLERKLKCELCNKSFKHDVSHTNHLRTAHNIVITISESQLPKQLNNNSSFTILEQKPSSNSNISLTQGKNEVLYQRQDVPTDLSFMALHSRKGLDASGGSLSHDALKMESPLMSSTEALMLDESDTLPYNVTSRMVQDFDLENLSLKGTETSVLAEDGGNRRLRMTVSRETVLATRLDGINNITGRQATVFKCHLCSRVFSSMLRFYHHLPSHFDTEIHTFDCRYCEAAFRSLTQIVKHLQCHREKFTGLNQSGTGLNSSALLLEEFHKKHKQDHTENGSLSSSVTSSLFSPGLHSEELHNGTAQHEPGERTNGGYTCVKCRKSFSREYLLQRHMRIHQTQNMFYCPDCESSFSREVDVLEHQKKVHGLKSAEQLQYSSLLKNISDMKQAQGSSRQASAISDSNNNNSSNSSLNPYPLADMKAFDLRLGEAVEVRVASDVAALDREELLRRAMLEQYKVLMSAPRGADQIKHALAALAAEELERRKKLKDGKMKREAEEENRVTEEVEKRRKVEQEQLKEKLAQEGMGDVTVVLPDAPPPDVDAPDTSVDMNRPRDLSVTSGPTSGVGFMARKMAAGTALTTSQYDLGLQAEAASVGSVIQGRQATLDAACTISETAAGGLKRIIPSSADPVSEPPSKNRRKAHKPQKINHVGEREKMEYMDEMKGEDSNNNKTTILTLPQHNQIQGIAQSLGASKPATDVAVSESISSFSNNGAIDLTTDNKDPHARLSATELLYLASRKIAVSSSSSCSNSSNSSFSSPPTEGHLKEEHYKNSSSFSKLDRSDSVDLSAFDSDNSQLSEAAQATDLSKTSLLSVQIPTDQDSLVGYPRVSWKNGNQRSNETSENILGIIHGGQRNGKASKTVVTSKSRASSPSPVPSPTNSDTSSTTEGRKVTITSLSRTHSRLSVVNEPLDRNSLCKPQVLDDGRSVYTCIICHKQFLSLSDINRHMDFHEDIRPYKCKYCDYYARTNSQLKVHKLRHEGVREFCCRVCNYKGVTQSDLNRHMKSQVHLLRSNHVCSQCGEGFVTPKTLRDHVCCTGSANKSFENSSANEIDDDADNEDYDDEENVNSETSQGSSTGVSKEVNVGAS